MLLTKLCVRCSLLPFAFLRSTVGFLRDFVLETALQSQPTSFLGSSAAPLLSGKNKKLGLVSSTKGRAVTVMVPALSRRVLLLSRTTHPAVLINTNAWHRYGELKSGCFKRVIDATNFATRLRSRRVGSERSVHTSKSIITPHGKLV